MIIGVSITDRSHYYGTGYIAGTADGIVTVGGQAAQREVCVLHDMQLVARVWSLASGHYMIPHLDTNREYLVIARDYKRQYEPVAYDHVKPATNLTPKEQIELYRSWR